MEPARRRAGDGARLSAVAGGATVGIDVGTTAVKAALIDREGRVAARFERPYPTRRPGPGRAEQDPADWLRLVDEAMAALSAADGAGDVAAVGLCAQANTHAFVDAAGAALMPAILWQDGRAGAEAAALDARVDPADRVAWWGAPMPVDASHPLARMLWARRHRPEVWDRTAHVLLPKDVCLRHLTGELATDPLSNFGLVDAGLAPIPDLLALVPGAAGRVAPMRPVTAVMGRVRAGRPFAGRPVAVGTMDAWAGLVGAGGAREGRVVYLAGTSEILGLSSRAVSPTPGVVVFPLSDGVRLHAAPTQAGGDALRWLAEAQGTTPAALSDLVAATPRGPATPLFLPQLEGERAPLWDASLRGAFLGLARPTGAGDLARAVMEGVALSVRHALGALRTSGRADGGPVACGGGGFRSEAWSQIRADVLGMELHVIEAGEPGVLGAATLAAVAAGLHPDLGAATAAMARVGRVHRPDAAAHALYGELFAAYLDAVEANAALGRRLTALASGPGLGEGAPDTPGRPA